MDHNQRFKSLNALEYARGSNLLGVAISALMKAKPDQWPMIAADALLKIADASINSHQRFLLSDCLQAYISLDEASRERYQEITKVEPYSKIHAMNKTPYDHGIQLGREQNMRDVTIALLESKYRAVPKPYLDRIRTLGYDDLLALVVRIPNAASMESLFLPS